MLAWPNRASSLALSGMFHCPCPISDRESSTIGPTYSTIGPFVYKGRDFGGGRVEPPDRTEPAGDLPRVPRSPAVASPSFVKVVSGAMLCSRIDEASTELRLRGSCILFESA
jgi:hypothetical protein